MCRTLVHELDHKQPNYQGAPHRHSTRLWQGGGWGHLHPGQCESSGRAAPSKATTKGARKGTKGGKKGQKRRPQRVDVVASSDSGNEKADNSSEKYVTTAGRDFKHQTQQPKDHFEKLLEATYPNHLYPVKHKLKD
jgi:hypothetical protein